MYKFKMAQLFRLVLCVVSYSSTLVQSHSLSRSLRYAPTCFFRNMSFASSNLSNETPPLCLSRSSVVSFDSSTASTKRINPQELSKALENSLIVLSLTAEEIKKLGWKLVQSTQFFTLYKRRLSKQGPYEYMMMGEFTDVSPRSFLLCQTREQLRSLWDDSMRSMNSLSLTPGQGLETQDFIYYRAKWPWPLKDRDYTLTRRVGVFPDSRAIVFVSRATEMGRPLVKDVMRVDNYRCHSVFFSSAKTPSREPKNPFAKWTRQLSRKLEDIKNELEDLGNKHIHHKGSSHIRSVNRRLREGDLTGNTVSTNRSQIRNNEDSLDALGVKFVTIFCDDCQKFPLPGVVIDTIASKAEGMAAKSFERLHSFSRDRSAQLIKSL